MSTVQLSGYIRVPAADLDAVRAALPIHIELTRAEPGCLQFDVVQDPDEPTVFHVEEQFLDPQSFSTHQQRVRESAWGDVTVRVERHYTVTGMPDPEIDS